MQERKHDPELRSVIGSLLSSSQLSRQPSHGFRSTHLALVEMLCDPRLDEIERLSKRVCCRPAIGQYGASQGARVASEESRLTEIVVKESIQHACFLEAPDRVKHARRRLKLLQRRDIPRLYELGSDAPGL